jgi:hypothetical protein
MSATASFVKIPKSALDGLRAAASESSADGTTYNDYLRKHGQEVATYKWSGFVLVTLLPYLQQKHQINLMDSECDELSSFLTERSGVTYFIFTDAQRAKYLDRVDARLFSENELRDYFNQFNGTNHPEAGRPMLDGVVAFQQCLAHLDSDSVVLFSIA